MQQPGLARASGELCMDSEWVHRGCHRAPGATRRVGAGNMAGTGLAASASSVCNRCGPPGVSIMARLWIRWIGGVKQKDGFGGYLRGVSGIANKNQGDPRFGIEKNKVNRLGVTLTLCGLRVLQMPCGNCRSWRRF